MRLRLGLRGQLMLALSVLFALLLALLSAVAVQLTGRARAVEQRRHAEAVAATLATSLQHVPPSEREAWLSEVAERVGWRAWHLQTSRMQLRSTTAIPAAATSFRVALPRGGSLQIWPRPLEPTPLLARLLVFYVALTAGAVLLLTYVAITQVLLRPMVRIARSAERLAAGQRPLPMPRGSALEVTRLSESVIDMAAQLQADRDELAQRLDDLQRATRELEVTQAQVAHSEKLASVGRLSAGVAHEIGNPLSAILGLLELLREEELPPGQREEYLARIQGETERIHKIIRDLLDFSRQGEAEADEKDATTDLAEAVDEALRLIGPQKEFRGIEVECALQEGLPRVHGAPYRIAQVLLNLLFNAADAMQGRGHIRIEAMLREDGSVHLGVLDDGPGIPHALLATLFEPFVTSKPVGEGTGLGLAVCHTLVTSLGGRIEARNRPQAGARFDIYLQAALEPGEDDAPGTRE